MNTDFATRKTQVVRQYGVVHIATRHSKQKKVPNFMKMYIVK